MKNTLLLFAIFAIALVGCSNDKDELSLDRSEISMYVGDKTQINASIGNENTLWVSNNDFIASVSNGIVRANKVGETHIIASAGYDVSCKVIVLPKYKTYEEPCMEWGVTKDYIRNKYGNPSYEDLNTIIYNINVPVSYIFKNGKLINSTVLVPTNKAEELGLFIKERYYSFKNQGSSIIGFMNANSTKDATISGGISVYNSLYLMVLYQACN